MDKLEIAKKIIEEKFSFGDLGLFDSSNMVGDMMTTLYSEDDLTICICYDYGYFEVFGLSESEFEELTDFYEQLEEQK